MQLIAVGSIKKFDTGSYFEHTQITDFEFYVCPFFFAEVEDCAVTPQIVFIHFDFNVFLNLSN